MGADSDTSAEDSVKKDKIQKLTSEVLKDLQGWGIPPVDFRKVVQPELWAVADAL